MTMRACARMRAGKWLWPAIASRRRPPDQPPVMVHSLVRPAGAEPDLCVTQCRG